MTQSCLPLNTGRSMPMLGLGVFKTASQEEMDKAVSWAFEAGYRMFDTAQMYGNEALLGSTLQHCSYHRKDYFLTSKLEPSNSNDPATALMKSLEDLQTDYLDLFMIHWPGQQKDRLLQIWQQMEALQKKGVIRSLGICNCTTTHLQWILENCEFPPAVHQVEHHPLLNETFLYDWCRNRGIQLQAWAPLMRGNLDHPILMEMAHRYEKSVAQIILRWDIQQGFSVIPKSVHRERIFQNANIFDFQLLQEDMAILNTMHTGQRSGKDPLTYDY